MKLRNFILILFLLAIGCQTMPAEEKVKNHLIELKCEIRDKATKKLLSNGALQLYSLPDTVEVGHFNVGFQAGEGYNDKKILQKRKYIAKFFTVNVEYNSPVKEVSGVFTGNAKVTESDEYEPQWIEVEITEADADAGVKKLEPVFLEKKSKFSVPKPAEVKRSKN